MSTCYWPECNKERTEGGFCDAHHRQMWTPREERREPPRYDDTLCPCGQMATRDGLCQTHYIKALRELNK